MSRLYAPPLFTVNLPHEEFFKTEAAGGIVLMAAAVLALVLANSPLPDIHAALQNPQLVFWVNDGLMAVFFFMIGLEVKREMVDGALSSRDRIVLPLLAAIAGMVVPAITYMAMNSGHPENVVGWAIPCATDIAFALCILALAGSRVPASIKVLLLAIAVIDDIGAIAIIALFYGHGFHVIPFIAAIAIAALMWLLNRRGVVRAWPYILLSVLLWAAVLQSGLHATLAGVVAAMFIPLRLDLEHKIHPFVAFAILPVFGLVNAGVPFAGMSLASLGEPLTAGIVLGLLIGKPVGIFMMIWAAVRLRLSPMPQGAGWGQVFGMSVLCGIGFTMSLFIGGLAFAGPEQQAAIRLGVLAASVAAALIGYGVLRSAKAV